MGACVSNKTYPANSVSTTLQRDHDRRIEERLRADQMEEKKVIKCLLLGAGECGKSTILKQMKILHQDGFNTAEEKANFKSLIWKNTLESIFTLCAACDALQIAFDSARNASRAEVILSLASNDSPLTHKRDILALWRDTGIQKALIRASEFHLLDSAPYFLAAAERILTPDYEPTTQDILRSRIATTGIIETEFVIDRLLFRMYDVGGQRGERKKWIHCFEDVTAILFIASLSEYDQVLAEDRVRNRLKESLDLFEGIINLPWFKDAPIILFLNKDDLFRVKISRVDIGIYFPQYTGGNDYALGLKFIQDEYFARNLNEHKTIYCFGDDTRVLTSRGFMFEAEVTRALDEDEKEAAAAATETSYPRSRRARPRRAPLTFACFDISTRSLVYRPGRLVHPENTDGHLLSFTPPEEQRRWSDHADEMGCDAQPTHHSPSSRRSPHRSNHLSLRVTPAHIMYVQRDGGETFEKVRAGDLVAPCACPPSPTACEHRRASVRFLACAAAGISHAATNANHAVLALPSSAQSYATPLGLTTRDECDAFLETYGFWLAAGTIVYARDQDSRRTTTSTSTTLTRCDAVQFAPPTAEHADWLESTLTRAGLVRGADWLQVPAAATAPNTSPCPVLVTRSSWFAYFDCEYWLAHSEGRARRRRAFSGDAAQKEADEIARLRAHGVSTPLAPMAQWLCAWVLQQLDRREVRLVVDGLRLASSRRASPSPSSKRTDTESRILVRDAAFRDQALAALLHAGYTACFEAVPSRHAASRKGRRHSKSDARLTTWRLRYSEPPPTPSHSHPSSSSSAASASAATPSTPLSNGILVEKYTGPLWCVRVDHPDHLLVAQRAHRGVSGIVTKSSRPVIVGNCHVTDATNTENIAFVWKATKHIILEQNLTRSGLLMC